MHKNGQVRADSPQAPRPGADSAVEIVDLLLFQARERLMRREWDGVLVLLGVASDIIEKVDDEGGEQDLSEVG